ncbi:MAG TPA: DUF2806 domain-containing protein, partial [Acetobacteraceae bacterium]|nr:DUF2806 domain-containing protein [Acetobacteraceae bacterium]
AATSDMAPDAPPISEDWMNVFESEAAHMGSEQMQHLFGKILAGEIRRPTSYSIKTIRLVAQLDNQAASLFKRLCSLSISLRLPSFGTIHDARVVSMGDANANSLQAYGLGFDALNILHEYGLIISDYNSHMDYRISAAYGGNIILPMTYQGAKWGLFPKVNPQDPKEFKVNGVVFSRSGKELLSIVEVDEDKQYTSALHAFLDTQGMQMVMLP